MAIILDWTTTKSGKYGQIALGELIAHITAIIVVSAILCLPLLSVGVFTGAYDAPTHALYQYYFSRQFWNGDFYPRWLAEANKGYGSPVFLIQYPFPYFITALLRPILSFAPTATREAHELGVYCFLVLSGAGIAARFWFRHRFTPVASTVAAIAYILLPFIMGQALYTRAAIGELSTFVWMPLLLALCDRIHPLRLEVLSAIGIVFALLIVSNILSAALFWPIVILYTIASRKGAVLPVFLALALGICIAAAYLFPLVAYQRFFDSSALPAHHPWFELGRSLLFISWADVYTQNIITIPGIVSAACLTMFAVCYIWWGGENFADRLAMLSTLGLGLLILIPGVGPDLINLSRLKVSGFDTCDAYSMKMLFTVLLTAGLGMLAYCRIVERKADPQERLLLAASCSAIVLMLPVSAPIWKAIPELAVIQFPWRLCGILTVAVAGLFAAAVDDCLRPRFRTNRGPSLPVMIFYAFAVIATGSLVWRVDRPWRAFSAPSINVSRQVDMMYPTYVPARKLAGFAKNIGTSPDTFDVAPTPVEAGVRADFASGKGNIAVVRLEPRKLLVSVESQGDARVRFSQLYFPLWTILPKTGSLGDGILGSSDEGHIEVSLTSGRHDFELLFDGGFPEKAGVVVTMASILLAMGGFAFGYLRARMP